jgi:predicted anti-sigma-YlaC factor YlaD
MSCESVREAAAVALLTREPLDADVREHLAGCAGCRDEVAQLGELPPLLDDAAEAFAASDTVAPSGLLDRMLAAAADRRAARRRRTLRATVLAAAAAVVVLILVPGGAYVWSQHNAVPGFHGSATSSASGVTAQLDLRPADVGTSLSMSISGVHPGTECTLVVHTKDGGSQTAATWAASYTGTAHVSGTVAAAVPTVSSVDVVDQATGAVLVQVPGPG